MITKFFDEKTPTENPVLTMDFSERLEVGETISSVVWKVYLVVTRKGVTTYTEQASMVSGSPDYTQQPLVLQKVQGGLDGSLYLHEATAVTSHGETKVGNVFQMVKIGA